ncbi:MAG: phage portal protein [Dehalococcoidia bacterium]
MAIQLTDRGKRLLQYLSLGALDFQPKTPPLLDIDVKSDRINPVVTQFYSNLPAAKSTYPASDILFYQAVAWVYIGISRIAHELASLPMEARVPKRAKKSTAQGSAEYDVLESGPAADIIARPNPDMGMYEILALMVPDLFLTGEGFLTLESDNQTPTGVPIEMYRQPSHKMETIVGTGEDLISHYEFRHGGGTRRFEVPEVIHIRMPNPNNHFHGLAPVASLKTTLTLHQAVLDYHKDFFRNCPIMGIGIGVKQQLAKEVRERLIEDLESKYGGQNRFRPPLMEGDVTALNLIPNLTELGFESLQKETRLAILAAFGVPPAIAGILEFANYSNMEQQERIMWKYGIIPPARLIESAINLRLPGRFPTVQGLEYRFNFERVAALHDNEGEIATRTAALYNAGIITQNEARQKVGVDPIPDGNIFKPMPSTSLFGDISNPDKISEGAKIQKCGCCGSSDRNGGSNALAHRSDDPDPKKEHWLRFDSKLTKVERSFAQVMAEFFKDQLDRTLERFDKTTGGKLCHPLFPYTKAGDVPDDSDAIFPRAAEGEALRQATEPEIKRVIEAVGADVFSSFGIDAAFDLTNPHVVQVISNGMNKITKINNTTWEYVKQILADGYNEGAPIATIRDNLITQFESWYKPEPGQMGVGPRCQLIARTEMQKFVNGGQFAAHQEAEGFGLRLEKVWLHSQADNAREDHLDADGQTVLLNDPFIIGGVQMMYPGDPDAGPDQICNCRCTYSCQEVSA